LISLKLTYLLTYLLTFNFTNNNYVILKLNSLNSKFSKHHSVFTGNPSENTVMLMFSIRQAMNGYSESS